MSEWISVKDGLPKANLVCLIWNEKRPFNYLVAIYLPLYQEFMHTEYAKVLEWPLEVTHWMPIPKPPNISDAKKRD